MASSSSTAATSTNQQHGNNSQKEESRSTLSHDIGAVLGVAAHGITNPAELWTACGPTLNELTLGLFGQSFRPERDIPDLAGKVVFITGGMFLSLFIRLIIHAVWPR